MSYELLGSIFMACMFGNLVWNIQKRLDRPIKVDYSDFIGRMNNGEILQGCNMFGVEHFYYDWHTCKNCGYKKYGDKWYIERGIAL